MENMWHFFFFNASLLIDTSGLLHSVWPLRVWFNKLCGSQVALKGLCEDLNIFSPYFRELYTQFASCYFSLPKPAITSCYTAFCFLYSNIPERYTLSKECGCVTPWPRVLKGDGNEWKRLSPHRVCAQHTGSRWVSRLLLSALMLAFNKSRAMSSFSL